MAGVELRQAPETVRISVIEQFHRPGRFLRLGACGRGINDVMRPFEREERVPRTRNELPCHHADQHQQVDQQPCFTGFQSPAKSPDFRGHHWQGGFLVLGHQANAVGQT